MFTSTTRGDAMTPTSYTWLPLKFRRPGVDRCLIRSWYKQGSQQSYCVAAQLDSIANSIQMSCGGAFYHERASRSTSAHSSGYSRSPTTFWSWKGHWSHVGQLSTLIVCWLLNWLSRLRRNDWTQAVNIRHWHSWAEVAFGSHGQSQPLPLTAYFMRKLFIFFKRYYKL